MDTQRAHKRVGRIDGENVILSQSWMNQLGMIFLALLLVAAVFYLNREFSEYTAIPIKTESGTFLIPFLFILPLVLFGKASFSIYNERFVLAPEYMIDVTGRLSWRERSVRLEYGRIQEIEIGQTIVQRILGLGDVIIIPVAGMTQTTINMHGVRHPRVVKDLIRERQKLAQQ